MHSEDQFCANACHANSPKAPFVCQTVQKLRRSAHAGRADEVIATDKEDLVSRVQEITGAV